VFFETIHQFDSEKRKIIITFFFRSKISDFILLDKNFLEFKDSEKSRRICGLILLDATPHNNFLIIPF